MQIEEYNKLCAEFMGLIPLQNPYLGAYTINDSIDMSQSFSDLLHSEMEGESWYVHPKFHSDWNWIMEVCTKLGMEFVITNREQLIQQIYDKLGKINKELEDEVDKYIHSLAFDEALIQNKLNGISILDLIPMFIKGYKAAQSKTYTEEDLENCIEMARQGIFFKISENSTDKEWDYTSTQIIQSLQPKYKQVELECIEVSQWISNDKSHGKVIHIVPKVVNDYVIVKQLIC